MEKPTVKHMQAVKRILQYVRGTVEYGLVYTKYHKGDVIIGYSNSNHARDVEDRWNGILLEGQFGHLGLKKATMCGTLFIRG